MIEFVKIACTVIVGVVILGVVLHFICSTIAVALVRAKEPKLQDVIHMEGENTRKLIRESYSKKTQMTEKFTKEPWELSDMSGVDAMDRKIERFKADNQIYQDMLNSLLNGEVYHLDNATMTNIKYELDNRGTDTDAPANAPDTGKMEE